LSTFEASLELRPRVVDESTALGEMGGNGEGEAGIPIDSRQLRCAWGGRVEWSGVGQFCCFCCWRARRVRGL